MVKVYQIFVGCPFLNTIRKNFDKLRYDIEKETPLHIVLADTMGISSTDYLLEHITGLIRDSAGCIFDVTGGNANVSLEVGIAHALPSDFLLTLKTRKPRTQTNALRGLQREGEAKPIISDLQGRNRVEYKTYPALKDQVLERYLNTLPYLRRWRQFRMRHSSMVEPALQIFDDIRTSGRALRPRVVSMLDGTGITARDLLDALSREKLITVKRGRAGGIYYPNK
ncbi:MAG: hypothetical protein RIE31_03835 [Alphaproteobacteria bacterium]